MPVSIIKKIERKVCHKLSIHKSKMWQKRAAHACIFHVCIEIVFNKMMMVVDKRIHILTFLRLDWRDGRDTVVYHFLCLFNSQSLQFDKTMSNRIKRTYHFNIRLNVLIVILLRAFSSPFHLSLSLSHKLYSTAKKILWHFLWVEGKEFQLNFNMHVWQSSFSIWSHTINERGREFGLPQFFFGNQSISFLSFPLLHINLLLFFLHRLLHLNCLFVFIFGFSTFFHFSFFPLPFELDIHDLYNALYFNQSFNVYSKSKVTGLDFCSFWRWTCFF